MDIRYIQRVTTTIFTIALIFFLAFLLAYYFNFRNHRISDNPADWGTFGDFLGGSLNSIISLLSLTIVMLFAVWQQRRDQVRNQEQDDWEARKHNQLIEFEEKRHNIEMQTQIKLSRFQYKSTVYDSFINNLSQFIDSLEDYETPELTQTDKPLLIFNKLSSFGAHNKTFLTILGDKEFIDAYIEILTISKAAFDKSRKIRALKTIGDRISLDEIEELNANNSKPVRRYVELSDKLISQLIKDLENTLS